MRREVAAAGKDLEDFEFVGGTRAVFPDDHSVADLGRAMDPIREQLEAGFTTFCIKPSQFIDDATHLEGFCRDVVARLDVMVGTERAPGQHNSGGDGLFTA